MHGATLQQAVILRHRVSPPASPMTGSSGVSSTPQLFGSVMNASEYWIARFRGRRRKEKPSLRAFAFSPRMSREFLLSTSHPPPRGERRYPKRGAGNAGRPTRPQPRMQNKKAYELVTTVTPVHPAFPAQWF
jgi:hypothetical protein